MLVRKWLSQEHPKEEARALVDNPSHRSHHRGYNSPPVVVVAMVLLDNAYLSLVWYIISKLVGCRVFLVGCLYVSARGLYYHLYILVYAIQ